MAQNQADKDKTTEAEPQQRDDSHTIPEMDTSALFPEHQDESQVQDAEAQAWRDLYKLDPNQVDALRIVPGRQLTLPELQSKIAAAGARRTLVENLADAFPPHEDVAPEVTPLVASTSGEQPRPPRGHFTVNITRAECSVQVVVPAEGGKVDFSFGPETAQDGLDVSVVVTHV